MNKKTIVLCAIILSSFLARSQEFNSNLSVARTPEPFLFSVSTLTPEDLKWSLNYSGSYGERVTNLIGFEGVNQQFAVKGYLGKQFTLYAYTALGISNGDNNVASAQQAEILRDFLGGKKNTGLRLGAGLGVRRDFSDVKSMLSRITFSYEAPRWKTTGNLLFEKAFASNRDKIDLITSIGAQYCLSKGFYGGIEAVGEDLEGLWDKEEAEGGAKILIGPSLNLTPLKSKFSFSVSGGPVFYATKNQIYNNEAIRELPSQAGLMVRARVIFNLSGS